VNSINYKIADYFCCETPVKLLYVDRIESHINIQVWICKNIYLAIKFSAIDLLNENKLRIEKVRNKFIVNLTRKLV